MAESRYPGLRIRFLAQGYEEQAWAIVDTGFEGHLAVPAELAAKLPPPLYVRRVKTASGQVVATPVFLGHVELLDQPGIHNALIIALGDEFLIGINVLNNYKVTFDHGQQVIVEP